MRQRFIGARPFARAVIVGIVVPSIIAGGALSSFATIMAVQPTVTTGGSPQAVDMVPDIPTPRPPAATERERVESSSDGASAKSNTAKDTRKLRRKRVTRWRPWRQRLGFVWPAKGWVTSNFGRRRGGFHHGIDIACRWGSRIQAAKKGRVIYVNARHPVYGRTIVVRHSRGFTTLYAHMARIWIRPGQKVKTGQNLGRCGTSGHSSGPHLHFELRRHGRFLRPAHFLP